MKQLQGHRVQPSDGGLGRGGRNGWTHSPAPANTGQHWLHAGAAGANLLGGWALGVEQLTLRPGTAGGEGFSQLPPKVGLYQETAGFSQQPSLRGWSHTTAYSRGFCWRQDSWSLWPRHPFLPQVWKAPTRLSAGVLLTPTLSPFLQSCVLPRSSRWHGEPRTRGLRGKRQEGRRRGTSCAWGLRWCQRSLNKLLLGSGRAAGSGRLGHFP